LIHSQQLRHERHREGRIDLLNEVASLRIVESQCRLNPRASGLHTIRHAERTAVKYRSRDGGARGCREPFGMHPLTTWGLGPGHGASSYNALVLI